MAKGRMISKSLSTSERRARLHPVAGPLAEFCQALYPLMVVHADDFGRHAGDPFTVKHVMDPTSPRPLAEFARALKHLDAVGLIRWYAILGRKYYEITDFDTHQSGLYKRTQSRIPEFPGNSRKVGKFSESREIPGKLGNSRKVGKFPESRESPGTSENFTGIPSELNRTEEKSTPPIVLPAEAGRTPRTRRRTTAERQIAEQVHIDKSREVKRLILEEGLSRAAAAKRLGYQ